MTDKKDFTFIEAYVVAKSEEPGGTITLRTRALNKKYDVFAPMPGFDVMLPSGVVFDFEKLFVDNTDGEYNEGCVGVLTTTFENNSTLRSRYDKERARACNENRDEELFTDEQLAP